MSVPDRAATFAALLAQSGLDPAEHDLAELQGAWERLTELLERFDSSELDDPERAAPLALFDPLRKP